jgi:hypothetical protein
MSKGLHKVSVFLHKDNYEDSNICVGVARDPINRAKFNTYLTDKELTCWLYCEDGMSRVDAEDYEECVGEQIKPGSTVVVYLNMEKGTVQFQVGEKLYK